MRSSPHGHLARCKMGVAPRNLLSWVWDPAPCHFTCHNTGIAPQKSAEPGVRSGAALPRLPQDGCHTPKSAEPGVRSGPHGRLARRKMGVAPRNLLSWAWDPASVAGPVLGSSAPPVPANRQRDPSCWRVQRWSSRHVFRTEILPGAAPPRGFARCRGAGFAPGARGCAGSRPCLRPCRLLPAAPPSRGEILRRHAAPARPPLCWRRHRPRGVTRLGDVACDGGPRRRVPRPERGAAGKGWDPSGSCTAQLRSRILKIALIKPRHSSKRPDHCRGF